MAILKDAKEVLKDLLLGKVRPPQKFFLGQDGSQQEIAVWLDGLGLPRDVTNRHSLACASPLTICVAFDAEMRSDGDDLKKLYLRFCEKDGGKHLLGRIGLKYNGISITTGRSVLHFFEVFSARSYCLPTVHLWMFYLQVACRRWRNPPPTGAITLPFLGMRAMDILFIYPRPIALGSSIEASGGNMFPLNVMGQLDDQYFGFGLKDARSPSHLIERARRIAVSTIPMEHADLAYQLGPNHSKMNGIEWTDLPFSTKTSSRFTIPVPAFALRVREIEVETIRKLGSHSFFVGRVVTDECFSEGIEWCVVHGHYQAWRLKTRPLEMCSSVAEDARVKRGLNPDSGLI